MRPRGRFVFIALALLLAACQRTPPPLPGAASEPAASARALAEALRRNDLVGYARLALPPLELQAMETAWSQDRSRWPLAELPMDDALPGLLATLSAPGAERQLRRDFDRQFAGQRKDIASAAHALTLFGTQYVQKEGDFSAAQRIYYTQVIRALGAWAAQAPLADAGRGHAAILRLTAAARATGLKDQASLRNAGLAGSLQRLGPFAGELKAALASYGLDLDQSLDALETGLVRQDGDHAEVRLRYPLAGQPIETVVALERRAGHWYPADYLRQAEAARAAAPAPPLPAQPPIPLPAPTAAKPAGRAGGA